MIGQKIGHYQIVRLLGEGGMGQVYEGHHREIERRAAIKILHRQFSENPEMATRFLNEMRAEDLRRRRAAASSLGIVWEKPGPWLGAATE